MARITERELVLPALHLMRESPGISTSQLIDRLTELLRPSGEDAQILEGRGDTKFSQKVRNLVSHHTMDQGGLGYSEYEHREGDGYHKITDKGRRLLEESEAALHYSIESGFDYSGTSQALSEVADARDAGEVLEPVPDGLVVSEGATRFVTRQVLERSRVLRDAAVAPHSKDGRIACAACGFDFRETYGEIGNGFVEMHHSRPLFHQRGLPEEVFVKSAVTGLVPLCSNCHRMIHARQPEPFTVEELSAIVRKNRATEA